MIRDYLEAFVGRPAAHWAGETLAALESWHADVLVADAYLPATLIAGEKLGIPTAAYCPNIWMLPTPGIPPFGPGWAPARGPRRSRSATWFLRILAPRVCPRDAILNAVRLHYGLPALGALHEQVSARTKSTC